MNATAYPQTNAPQPPVRIASGAASQWSAPPQVRTHEIPCETPEQKADSFNRASSALVIVGLLMLGGAIAPLLAFLQMGAVAKYFIGLGYLAACCLVVTWLAGRMFRHSTRREAFVRATRVGVLMVGECALMAFTAACAPFAHRWEVTACVLAATPVVLLFALPRERRMAAYLPLRINEMLVMFALALVLLEADLPGQTAIAPIATFGLAVALSGFDVAWHAHELVNGKAPGQARNGLILASTAVAFTLLVAVFVLECMPFAQSPYAYDVVFMASALVCAGLGFRANEPALRRTGLAFALLTILKMCMVDTLGFDPLPKAVAYLVGGAVCFAIGGMYSYAVKRLRA